MQVAADHIRISRGVLEAQNRQSITDATVVEVSQSFEMNAEGWDRQFVLGFPHFVHVAAAQGNVKLGELGRKPYRVSDPIHSPSLNRHKRTVIQACPLDH